MKLEAFLRRWSQGWRGPFLAALIALAAGLPGLLAVPPLDRDESRFAQATAQMLEDGDFVVIRFQDAPRFKKPVGIHWMQAASVRVFSDPEARQIWAYRLPSLAGAMLAAAACAWGAAAFFGGGTSLAAGAILGSTLLLSTEAFIAKTDAVLCGTTTLAMAALGRIYAARDGPGSGRRIKLLFWLGISLATLVKGPVGPMVVMLAALTLAAWDRRAGWLKTIGWGWGLILLAAICGPWAGAVTIATDGAFWTTALASDLAPKLAGGQETHGAPPGYHTAMALILFFPATLLLPAAAVTAWRERRQPGVRFALAWLAPAWLVFELVPTKLAHYPLPAYGALAWLAAAALRDVRGPGERWTGAALSALAGLALAAGVFYLTTQYGDAGDVSAAAVAGGLLAMAGLAGGFLLIRKAQHGALAVALGLGIAGHAALAALLLPRLGPLWLSHRTEAAMAAANLLPRQGMASAPVAVAGYAEPSLVFALGTPTELGGADEAAAAIADGRPAVVEAREEPAFRRALAAVGAQALATGEVKGLDYSNGDRDVLRIYRPKEPPGE
ncbi:glycosyltransferase family 39 protein [Phenylobacterium sp.]|uniref:ArnT family glycosyltransferase n=1 Tax=Phenylobacterium sp. TaxID=1871053 RepID=UPI002F40026E